MSWNDDGRANGTNAGGAGSPGGAWPPPGGSPGWAQPDQARPAAGPPAAIPQGHRPAGPTVVPQAPAYAAPPAPQPAPPAPGSASAPHAYAPGTYASGPYSPGYAPFSAVQAPPTRPARLGRLGVFLWIGSVLPVIASYVIAFAGYPGAVDPTSTRPFGEDSAQNALLVAIGATALLQWLLLIAATVLGIVSLARRERPLIWGILAVASIPTSVVLTWIANFVLLIIGLGTVVAATAGRG